MLNEKKFIIVKLYGGKLNTNTPPRKKGDKNITPLIHGVIGHSLARQLFQIRYKPLSETTKLQSNEVSDFSYNDYLGEKVHIKIQIFIYQIDKLRSNHLLHLPVTYDHLKEAVISPQINNNIDVSIIICKTFFFIERVGFWKFVYKI